MKKIIEVTLHIIYNYHNSMLSGSNDLLNSN
jgi:hypothetical protein